MFAAAKHMLSLVLFLFLSPPTDEEAAAALLADADPAQLAALEAMSSIDPAVLERLDATSRSELDTLMLRRARGEELTREEEQLVEANVRVSTAGFDAKLHYQSGLVALGDGVAELELGSSYRFLGPEGAHTVLTEAWGNQVSTPLLGMVAPSRVSVVHPFEGWGVTIRHNADGHVDDAGAASLDFDEALDTLRRNTEVDNASRVAAGGPAMHVQGWATTPRYDAEHAALTWAVEYSDDDSDSPNTVNHAVRLLSRDGVLEFNAIGRIDQQATLEAVMSDLLRRVHLAPGQAYGDFEEGKDLLAPYDLDTLVAGTPSTPTWLGVPLRNYAIGALVLFALGLAWTRRSG